MGSKSTKRRKHAETAKANGQALADQEGAVYQQNSRHWWAFSPSLMMWYEIILGATGFVCACDDQQGRSGICKHVSVLGPHVALCQERKASNETHPYPEVAVSQQEVHSGGQSNAINVQ